MQRSSGILLPLTALPSRYGIGTMGRAAYSFVDFLAKAGQSWWQLLPVGPTSYGDSPYQSFSTYAGNPYLIDLRMLMADDLLTLEEVESCDWGDDETQIDYEKIYNHRFEVLRLACNRGWDRDRAAISQFEQENHRWLPDYALYMAIKRANDMKSWLEWPDEALRRRDFWAMHEARSKYKADVQLFIYIQFLFYRQWRALRTYANERGVKLFGDLPIYVALDSADVWAEPEQFQLDENFVPTAVAGVPPDYFSETGQLWGNPLYNWDKMRADGYNWWIRRMDGVGKLYDMIRIDHFRGLESYWSIPYGDETAVNGHWVKGPGLHFVQTIMEWFPHLGIVAEDLGVESEDVNALLKNSGLPGMKVLQFAFQEREQNPYQPHTYTPNCICYCGTHDNNTILGWAEEALEQELSFTREYLGLSDRESLCWGMIRGGMRSVANLFIGSMQDYLELGAEARINTPGTLGGNWTWRMRSRDLSAGLAQRIRLLSETYGRVITSAKPEPKLR